MAITEHDLKFLLRGRPMTLRGWHRWNDFKQWVLGKTCPTDPTNIVYSFACLESIMTPEQLREWNDE